MAKVKTTAYLTKASHEWLQEQSIQQGLSKNDIVQTLINREMRRELIREPTRA